MDYELAKKLKDAGFPQEGGGRNWEWDDKSNAYDMLDVYIPTLSEFIEACGEDFEMLSKESYGWECGYIQNDNWYSESTGKSPEEAVAKLYLKLQEEK